MRQTPKDPHRGPLSAPARAAAEESHADVTAGRVLRRFIGYYGPYKGLLAADLLCAVAQTGAGHIHCGVAHTDNGHALAQIVLARVGQIINAKKHVAAAFSLNTQGARPPNAGADKNGPIIIAEKVINAQSVANGGV